MIGPACLRGQSLLEYCVSEKIGWPPNQIVSLAVLPLPVERTVTPGDAGRPR